VKHHPCSQLRQHRLNPLLFALLAVGAINLLGGPDSVQASEESERLTALASASLRAERPEEAIPQLDAALKADSKDIEPRYWRGIAKAQTDDIAGAKNDLESVLVKVPTHGPARRDLGILLFREREYEKALSILAPATKQPDVAGRALLYSGLCHWRSGNHGQAEASFGAAERADVDLQGSVAYYRGAMNYDQANLDAARSHFTSVINAAPNSQLAEASRKYLELVDEAEDARFELSASAGFQYDSNVTLTNGVLKDAISDKADGRAVFLAEVSGVLHETADSRVSAGYAFFQDGHFKLSEFDIQNHSAWTDLEHQVGDLLIGATVSWDYYFLDGESFMDESSVSPAMTYSWGDGHSTEWRYRWQHRTFHQRTFNGGGLNDSGTPPANRDADIHTAGLRHFVDTPKLGLLYFGYEWTLHDPRESDDTSAAFGYNGHGLQGGLQKELFEDKVDGLNLEIAAEWREEDYSSRSALYSVDAGGDPNDKIREDQDTSAYIGLSKELDDMWTIVGSYLQVINKSSDARFDYDRSVVGLSVEATY
jgi:tetratricopeptide (TPR) repeat protein